MLTGGYAKYSESEISDFYINVVINSMIILTMLEVVVF